MGANNGADGGVDLIAVSSAGESSSTRIFIAPNSRISFPVPGCSSDMSRKCRSRASSNHLYASGSGTALAR